jgi:hypothetical protein
MADIQYPEPIQYITDATGERSGVILSLEQFAELLEDLADLAVIAERRDEPTLSHEELLAELRNDGLLPD